MKTLATNERAVWPSENIIRAKYYLSQILRQRDPNNEKAVRSQREVEGSIEQSLIHEGLKEAAAYHGNYPILVDYMVPWKCRLITPRKAQRLAVVPPCSSIYIWHVLPKHAVWNPRGVLCLSSPTYSLLLLLLLLLLPFPLFDWKACQNLRTMA